MKLNTAIYAYGTSEGVRKEWDSRGRGRRFSWNPAADGEQAAKKDEHLEDAVKEKNSDLVSALTSAMASLNKFRK